MLYLEWSASSQLRTEYVLKIIWLFINFRFSVCGNLPLKVMASPTHLQ